MVKVKENVSRLFAKVNKICSSPPEYEYYEYEVEMPEANPFDLDNPERPLVGGRYKLIKLLGKGSFCSAYLAQHVRKIPPNGTLCVKIERTDDEKQKFRQLHFESKLYELLRNEEGIPVARQFGKDPGFNYLAMELLGPTLDELHSENAGRFSNGCLCIIAIQIITRLETLHKYDFIHRDIKPENFLVGRYKKRNTVYLCDLGLCKKFRSSSTNAHIAFSTNRSLAGTARYASIHALSGCEQSRRDDLEALGYMLVYLAKGRLPWQGFKDGSRLAKYRRICDCKKTTTTDILCDGLSVEFGQYVSYTRGLKFEEDPNYNYMRNLFNNRLNIIKAEMEGKAAVLDWIARTPSKYQDILEPCNEPLSVLTTVSKDAPSLVERRSIQKGESVHEEKKSVEGGD